MAYADADTLAGKLKVNATTHADDLARVLDAATYEIDREIAGPLTSPTDGQLALLETVCLGRAQDLWLIEGLPVGVIGLGGETPFLSPRDSWERWAIVLSKEMRDWSEVGIA